MKLIDADEFLYHMEELYKVAGWNEREIHFSLADIRSNIDCEARIKLEPAIKCKDCRHWITAGTTSDGEIGSCRISKWFGGLPHSYDYCSRAERREDD